MHATVVNQVKIFEFTLTIGPSGHVGEYTLARFFAFYLDAGAG